MIPPKNIRYDIANRMIRIVAPATVCGMLLITVVIILMGSRQYSRLIPAGLTLIFIIPSWILASRGKALAGAKVLLTSVNIAILIGIILNGGPQAPAYIATVSFATIFTILYGALGGFLYALGTISIGFVSLYMQSIGILSVVPPPPAIYIVFIIGICLFVQIVFVSIPVRMMLLALDKSKRQGAELNTAVNEQKTSQSLLESILDKTPDIIFRLDNKGNITFINNAVRRYNLIPESVLGNPIFDYIHPDDIITAQDNLINLDSKNRGERAIEVRVLGNRKMGQSFSKKRSNTKKLSNDNWATFNVEIDDIYSEKSEPSGNPIGIQGIARDISRIKHFEKQSTQLAVVVEQADDVVIITDIEGTIQYVNSKFVASIGYSKKEIIGKKISVLSSLKHDRVFYTNLWTDIKNGNVWNGRIWHRKKDGGTILHDTSIFPIFDSNNNITEFATIHRDMTQQEKFDERIRQSQKMEAIGTLAGGVAHDFNNILGAIIGYAELSQYDLKENDPVKGSIDQILKASHRAKDLVKQILLFSRQSKQEMIPVKISHLIKEVVKLLNATLPSTIKIEFNFSATSDLILANSGQIHQIIMNLCTNAAHAMDNDKGTIILSTDQFRLDQDSVALFPELSIGQYLRLQVKDNGCGIPLDIIDKIFDPFFTTKTRDEGTGLGLSVVHGIIESHKGTIRVVSDPGNGSTFDLFLPVLETEELSSSPHKLVLHGGKEHILFVDDELALVEVNKKILKNLGYLVTSFLDSMEAWETFQKNPDQFDLVITDKTMPQMTGLELAKKIHGTRADIPIILCTGFGKDLTLQEVNEIGIREILNKPVNSKEISEVLYRTLDKTS